MARMFRKADREPDTPLDLDGPSERFPEQISRASFRFTYKLKNGEIYTVNLSRFAVGCRDSGQTGFPDLMAELLPFLLDYLRAQPRSKEAIKSWLTKHFTYLFQWLSYREQSTGKAPARVSDFTIEDGQYFKEYLLAHELVEAKTYLLKAHTLLLKARGKEGEKLLWPAVKRAKGGKEKADINPSAMKALYNVIKRILDDSEREFRIDSDALAEGIEPNDSVSGDCHYVRNDRDDLTILFHKYLRSRVLNSPSISKAERSALFTHIFDDGQVIRGFVGRTIKQRSAFYAPSSLEVCAAVLLVSMETGWIDTVSGINLHEGWFEHRRGPADDPSKTDSVVLNATRPKTGKMMFAVGQSGSKFRSFQVINGLVERSETLRTHLRELRDLKARPGVSKQNQNDIVRIDNLLASPWLYFVHNQGAGVNCFGRQPLHSLMADTLPMIKERAIKALKVGSDTEQLIQDIEAINWKDCRDALAAHVYKESGGNLFLVKKTLGHSSFQVTRSYLRQKRLRKEHFESARKVIDAALAEVVEGRSIDPTILFLAANYEDFGPQDRERLVAHRTSMGMGCLNPYAPDTDAWTVKSKGEPCSVQRCVLCKNGVVFKDAWGDLAIRHAELVYLRGNTAPDRWITSPFSWELEAIELLWNEYFTDNWDGFLTTSNEYLAALKSGDAFLFDDADL